MSESVSLALERPGGAIAYSRVGSGSPLLLLHATLSSARQLRTLAAKLSARHTVLTVDRRGSGESTVAAPSPAAAIDVAVHVDDLAALAASERSAPSLLVGHSYGGCIALEMAARRPELVRAVMAWEPPYMPLASPAAQQHMADVARRMQEASDAGDPAAAALVFMAGVSGQAAVEALSPAARRRIGRAGAGAVADATLVGMDVQGLSRISCPVLIATGEGSDPLYADIAEALVSRIPGAAHQRVEDLDHMAPVTRPDSVAATIEAFASR